VLAGQNSFATEIETARGGEVDLPTRLNKVDTSLANMEKSVRYSQLGSTTALKNALLIGISVDLDENINLDQTLTLLNSSLYTSNKSKINLVNSESGIVVKNNSMVIDAYIIQNAGIVFSKPAIICTLDATLSNKLANIKITNPTIILNGDIDSIGIQLLELEGFGLFDVNVDNYLIQGARKGIELKVISDDIGWVNGNSFLNGHITDFDYAVFTNMFHENGTYCSGNTFINLKTQSSNSIIQTIYDIGDNVYTNSWFYDLGGADSRPNLNRLGIIQGALNLPNFTETAKLNGIRLMGGGVSTDYVRVGFFNKAYLATDVYAELKFYGANGDRGTINLKLNDEYTVIAKADSNELANSIEVYSLPSSDNKTIAIFLKNVGGINGWTKISLYEKFGFMGEDGGLYAFANAMAESYPIIKGTMTKYTKKAIKDAIVAYVPPIEDFIVGTLVNGWSGSLSFRKNMLGQVHVYGTITVVTPTQSVMLLPVGYRPIKVVCFPMRNALSEVENGLTVSDTSGELKMRNPIFSTLVTGNVLPINILFQT